MLRIVTLTTGCALFGAAALAFGPDEDYAKFMKAELPKLEKAFNTKDIGYFQKNSTDDFVSKENGRTMNKKESLAQMKQMFGMAQAIKTNFKVVSSSVKGNLGTAMVEGDAILHMKPMKAGEKGQTWQIHMWEKEVWQKVGKTWKMKSIEQSKPPTMKIDGKVVDPTKMGG